jgi:hypothetical protein
VGSIQGRYKIQIFKLKAFLYPYETTSLAAPRAHNFLAAADFELTDFASPRLSLPLSKNINPNFLFSSRPHHLLSHPTNKKLPAFSLFDRPQNLIPFSFFFSFFHPRDHVIVVVAVENFQSYISRGCLGFVFIAGTLIDFRIDGNLFILYVLDWITFLKRLLVCSVFLFVCLKSLCF